MDSTAALPGGDFPHDGFEALTARLRGTYPFLSRAHARRLVRAYGTRAELILGSARRLEDLGRVVGADLTEAEIQYLVQNEWAQTTDDVLWRRSKLGLHTGAEDRAVLETLIRSGRPSAHSAA